MLQQWYRAVQDRLRLQLPGQLCWASPGWGTGGSWRSPATQWGQKHRQLDHPIKMWVYNELLALKMIPQWLTDFGTLDSFWIRLTKLCWTWISVLVPRVTSVQWMLKLYSVVMAGLGIILSLSWTCFHVYVLSVTQLPELRQQRWINKIGGTWNKIKNTHIQIFTLFAKEQNNGKWKWLWSQCDCDYDGENPIRHSVKSFLLRGQPSWAYIDHHWWRLSWTFLSFLFNLILENNL